MYLPSGFSSDAPTRVLVGLRSIIILCGLAAALAPCHATAGQTNLQFLVTGIDAEAAGIGDAGIGSSQAAFASFWNPAAVADAGLAGARGFYDGSTRAEAEHEIGIAHHIWVGATRTYGAGGRFRAGRSGGVAVFAIATDTEAQSSVGPTGTAGATYLETGATYARSFGSLLIGLTGKFIAQSVSSANSSGFAMDAGIIADVFDHGVRMGASLLHVGRMSELPTIDTELPTTLRLGLALYPFRIVAVDDGFPLLDLMFALEVSQGLVEERMRVHVGASGVLLETLVARVGYVTNDPLRGPTMGLGLSYEALNFDYAVIPFEDGFGGPGHILTLTYGW